MLEINRASICPGNKMFYFQPDRQFSHRLAACFKIIDQGFFLLSQVCQNTLLFPRTPQQELSPASYGMHMGIVHPTFCKSNGHKTVAPGQTQTFTTKVKRTPMSVLVSDAMDMPLSEKACKNPPPICKISVTAED
ncbi:hypothetical protein [uncultured Gemmiger sp.]|uniref:hypothetical protein n=1 Tax=uncultured Gemmiger sp. TaxID=1623490 RepID=UPI0025CBCE01|nr:hypothetical protein [uncultured Gemmiger sp.]